MPLTEIVDPFAVKLPKVATASAPAVMPRFDADVVKIVGPVAPPVELRIVSVAPILRALTAIVYVMLGVTLASSVRLLNSFVPPARAANLSVPLAASRIVTVLVPATHDADVDRFVHVPLTVHVDAPRLTIVPAVSTSTSPVTMIVEFRARRVPWIANGPFTVRAQLDAVVSSVPVKLVMSMLAIVVAAASVVVPVGVALKTALFVATGVQAHAAPPEVFDQFAPVAQVPPAPIR